MSGADTTGIGQRTHEWDLLDQRALAYHMGQWQVPKRSTVAFEEFVRPALQRGGLVVDLGCGAGAATAYLAERYPDTRFVGIDFSSELVSIAGELARQKHLVNLSFTTGDWFDLADMGGVTGAISMQTLSWLPEYERPLTQAFSKLGPAWLALSSLFYEGDISCRIEVQEHARGDRKTFYNVYAIPAVARHCAIHGYAVSRQQRFDIDTDLERPGDRDAMATYTVRTEGQSVDSPVRLQISGPLLMNWYTLLIDRQ